MMIRIGNTILNEAAIEAIEYYDNNRVSILMRSGREVIVDCMTMEEVYEALTNAGLIKPLGAEPITEMFSTAEIAAMKAALLEGHRYIAKDKDGKVFAYKDIPSKRAASWDGDFWVRLHGDYNALAFEDECPMDLCALLSEDVISC